MCEVVSVSSRGAGTVASTRVTTDNVAVPAGPSAQGEETRTAPLVTSLFTEVGLALFAGGRGWAGGGRAVTAGPPGREPLGAGPGEGRAPRSR